jgi:hypothetical protein
MDRNGRPRFRRALAICVAGCALAVAAAGAVTAPAAATTIQDRYTKQNALIIQDYIERSGKADGFIYPAVSKVVPSMGSLWPSDMYRAGLMRPGAKNGQYTYKLGAGGTSYRLVVHLGSGDWTLTGGTPALVTRLRNTQVRTATSLIRQYVELYAGDHNGVYPPVGEVVQVGAVGTIWSANLWPLDPWTLLPMTPGTKHGEFGYAVGDAGSSYTLTGSLSGADYVLEGTADQNLSNLMRIGLKNEIAIARAQVLKDYVDAWKAQNAGILPSVDQVTSTGSVGGAHTWWPANPWTLEPMAPGTGYGDYTYTPGPDGRFTVSVVLQPRDGYTSPYVAQ